MKAPPDWPGMENLPRMLGRTWAAYYLGVSPNHFDRLRKLGRVPAPHTALGVNRWDKRELDKLLGDIGAGTSENPGADEWNKTSL